MDIKKTNHSGYYVNLECNRKVKLTYQPNCNCWEIIDTTAGSLGSVTLSTRELNDILKAFTLLSKENPVSNTPMVFNH